MYILVAGKMYPDPTPVRPRTFAIAGNAMASSPDSTMKPSGATWQASQFFNTPG